MLVQKIHDAIHFFEAYFKSKLNLIAKKDCPIFYVYGWAWRDIFTKNAY
jgi:hypothetical protein